MASNFTTDNFVFAPGDNTNSVRYDFTVPRAGDYSTSISWSSSNTNVLDFVAYNSIHVTNRPSSTDEIITLMANITRGAQSVSVDVQVKVKMYVPQIITDFKFILVNNAGLGADIFGLITRVNDSSYDVIITVPSGKDISNLIATFFGGSCSVEVSGVPQTSGVTANDFSVGPVIYQVITSSETQSYTVKITNN